MPQWDPHDYERHSFGQETWARECVEMLAIYGNERVLDVGCGDGRVTAMIAKKVPRGCVLGVDSSSAMVERASVKYPANQNANLEFRVRDARDLGFVEEFDWIVSFSALHWVKDHRMLLRGSSSALKPGGKLFLQFGGKGNVPEVLEATEKTLEDSRWADRFRGFEFPWVFLGPEEYTPWVLEAGLIPIRVQLVPKTVVHPDADSVKAWFRTAHSLPYVERLPEGQREHFLDRIAEEYVAAVRGDLGGPIELRFIRLQVEAEKPRP